MNQSFQSKKHYERQLLLEAIALSDAFPSGVMNAEVRESPDFILYTHEAIIGIELTTFPLRDNSSGNNFTEPKERDRVLAQALKLYRQMTRQCGRVLVYWKESATMVNSDVFSDNLAVAVARHNGAEGFLDPDILERYDLSDCLSRIHFCPLPHQMLWCSAREALYHVNAAEIQMTIDRKNAFLERYLLHCHACYLLIVAHSGDVQPLTASVRTHRYRSGFRKLLFYYKSPWNDGDSIVYPLSE